MWSAPGRGLGQSCRCGVGCQTGTGGNGGLARNKSFFQKTLEARRGAFWPSSGRVRGGHESRSARVWRVVELGGQGRGSGGGVAFGTWIVYTGRERRASGWRSGADRRHTKAGSGRRLYLQGGAGRVVIRWAESRVRESSWRRLGLRGLTIRRTTSDGPGRLWRCFRSARAATNSGLDGSGTR